MSKYFKVVGLFSIVCLAVVMTACGGPARVEEKSNEAVIVTRPSRVVVETFNGNIEVVIGAADKVAVEVNKFTDPDLRDILKDIEFSISQDAQTVTVKARWPDAIKTSPGNTGVDLKVSIPAGSPVQAVVGNGKIIYHGALGSGDYAFETGNGSIELQLPAEAQFSINARVGNGRITSEFPLGNTSAEAHVVNGRVGGNPQASITAVTGNGRIEVKRSN
jgi:DUF4097 and DUF4098 domain-containing protein YvlB